MVHALTARNISLGQLNQAFNLTLQEDPAFFPEWQQPLPEITPSEQARLDRIKASFTNLLNQPALLEDTVKMVVLSPLLDLANFYLPPFAIQSETSVEVTTHDRNLTIRGNLDILVICNQVWILTIESKQAAVSLEAGRAQLLSYMLANPKREQPSFGLLTNGSSFRFVKLGFVQLTDQPTPQYALSRLFDLFNPGRDLDQVLAILKAIAQKIQPIEPSPAT